MSFAIKSSLPTVEDVIARLPLSPSNIRKKQMLEEQLQSILSGNDSRRLLIIGPCAADYEDIALEYVRRLSLLQEEVKDKLFLLPRIYTAKPRSSLAGYTGMLYYPDPESECNIADGITTARKLHIRILQEYNMISADEMLYLDLLPYIKDVISYFTVGARSVENQVYSWMASGLDVPVGFKNPRCGEVSKLVHAVVSASRPHVFSFGNNIVETTGNEFAHGILRGYSDAFGLMHSNYDSETIHRFFDIVNNSSAKCSSLIVDCSHDNSGKNADKQAIICRNIIKQMKDEADVAHFIKGLMVESYLVSGSRKTTAFEKGISLVDDCIGWETTRSLVYQLAQQLP